MSNSGLGTGQRTDPHTIICAITCFLCGSFLAAYGRRGGKATFAISTGLTFALIVWTCTSAAGLGDWTIFAITWSSAMLGASIAALFIAWLGWLLTGIVGGLALATSILSMKAQLLFWSTALRCVTLALFGILAAASVAFTPYEGAAACSATSGSFLLFFGIDILVTGERGWAHALSAIFGAYSSPSLDPSSYQPPLTTLIFIGCSLLLAITMTVCQCHCFSGPFLPRTLFRQVETGSDNERDFGHFQWPRRPRIMMPLTRSPSSTSRPASTYTLQIGDIRASLKSDAKLASSVIASYLAPVHATKGDKGDKGGLPTSADMTDRQVPTKRDQQRTLNFSASSDKLRKELEDICAFNDRRISNASKRSTVLLDRQYITYATRSNSFASSMRSSECGPPSYHTSEPTLSGEDVNVLPQEPLAVAHPPSHMPCWEFMTTDAPILSPQEHLTDQVLSRHTRRNTLQIELPAALRAVGASSRDDKAWASAASGKRQSAWSQVYHDALYKSA